MNKGFYSSGLLAFIALLFASVAVVVTFALVVLRVQALDAADDRLVRAHHVMSELIDRRDDGLSETAKALARDPALRGALRSPGQTGLAGLLRTHKALGVSGELILLDGNGSIRAHSGDAFVGQNVPVELVNAQDAIFLPLGDRVYRYAFAPMQIDGQVSWLGTGVPLASDLAQTVKSLTGVEVTLRQSNQDRTLATTLVGEQGGASRMLSTNLESRVDNQLEALFSISHRAALTHYREVALQLAAMGFGLAALAALLAAITLSRVANRFISTPLRALRAAVDRVRQGVYTEDVDFEGDDAVGRLARAFNQMQNEIAERESRIVHHAEFDSLTGLTNRSVVDERLAATFGRAQRRGANLAAMLIDIERFSDINGTLGNEVGDAVLKEVARRLASNTRATDLLARVGGDEFLIVVEDMETQLATHISAFLAETLQKPIKVEGRTVNLRVRIGVALYPEHCDTPKGIRRLVNVALTTARETGQSVVMYQVGQDERHLRELAILNDLPKAIKHGQLELHYQPKLDIKARVVETVEALVRWTHPQLGRIPPDEFVGVLEHHNKTQMLTDWVLKAAIEQSRDWSGRGYDIGIAVNLSANDLHDPGLCDRISAMLHHYLVEPSRISVEVTESAVMSDPERAREILTQLREIGLRIAIDDFGTGQTSLSLLKQLPLNELKIDKSFVQELRANSGDAIIVKSTIDLGHNMGLLVVAEGVESTYGWNLLKSYKCDVVQGYLVSKPLPATQLEAWYLRLQAKQASRLDFSFLDKQPKTDDNAAAEPQTISDILS